MILLVTLVAVALNVNCAAASVFPNALIPDPARVARITVWFLVVTLCSVPLNERFPLGHFPAHLFALPRNADSEAFMDLPGCFVSVAPNVGGKPIVFLVSVF